MLTPILMWKFTFVLDFCCSSRHYRRLLHLRGGVKETHRLSQAQSHHPGPTDQNVVHHNYAPDISGASISP